MTMHEAKAVEGDVRKQIVGQRKLIEGVCREAIEVHIVPANNSDYELVVVLSSSNITTSVVTLDTFINCPKCY